MIRLKSILMSVAALVAAGAFGIDGVWTYTDALDNENINWTNTTYWSGGAVPNGSGDTADLTGVESALGKKIQRINVPSSTNRLYYYHAEAVSLTLASVAGLKNQQIRQLSGIKSLVRVDDPSSFLGPWSVTRPYSGLEVGAAADTTVPQVMAANMFELSLPTAGVKTTIGKVRDVGTMIKKGPGDLKIVDGGADAMTLRIAGSGKVEIGRDKSNDAQPVAGSFLHLDASKTNTMELVVENGKTFVRRWNDCNGTTTYAEQADAIPGSATNRPTLKLDYLNGMPVVDFGAFYGNNIGFGDYQPDTATYGETAWMNVKNTHIPRIAFVLMQEVSADHCDAVAVGNTGAALWYRFVARKDTVHYAGVPIADDWGDFLFYRDGISLNGRNVAHDRPANLTEWTIWCVPYGGTTTFNAMMRDRVGRYGGARVAEVIAYSSELTDAEIRQNIAYLKNKWLKGLTAEGDDVDLGTAVVEADGVKLEVAEGQHAKIGRIESWNRAPLVKSGAGSLSVENVVGQAPIHVTVEAGTLRIEDVSPDASDSAPAGNPTLWLSADADSSRFEFQTVDGVKYISRWNDVRTEQTAQYAYNDGGKFASKRTYQLPYLDETNTLNGKPVVNFGNYYTATNASGNAQGAALRFVNGGKGISAREAFIVYCDNDTGHNPWILGSSDISTGLCRSIQSARQRLVAEDYVQGYVGGGRWYVDAQLVNPMDYALGVNDFKVIDFALSKAAAVEYLGCDRPKEYARSGGMCIAELLCYDRELTDKERRDTQAYLLKKWKNREHPDSQPVRIASVSGSGRLEIARSVSMPGGAAAAEDLLRQADLRFDASAVDTIEFGTGSQVERWHDANGSGKMLCATSAAYTPNRPALITATINGASKNAITLSGMTKSTSASSGKGHLAATDGNGASFDLCSSSGALTSGTYREFFVVMADCGDNAMASASHRAAMVDSTFLVNPVFYRDTGNNGQLIRNTYARPEAYTSTYWKDGEQLDFGWDADNKATKTANVRVTDTNYHVYAIAGTGGVKIDHVGVWLDNGNTCYYGGKNICEMLCYADDLDAGDRARIITYLREKWQSVNAGYSDTLPANVVLAGGSIDTGTNTEVTVAAGAVLGAGRITAKSVSSAGDMAFEFTSPTQCSRLDVTGSFALGASGVVTIGGKFKPEFGEYTIVKAASVSGGANLDAWTVDDRAEGGGRTMLLKVAGDEVRLAVVPNGLRIILR